MTPRTRACTSAKSTAGPRFAAASNVFDGTQPVFRQSPPMAPRSISTVSAPICAAPAATDSPPDPAPITHRSQRISLIGPVPDS